jgi:predicted alpha/beta-hydrolase family hydrolase
MQAWRTRLESLGEVHAFDYPYMTRGSRRPDPLPKLIAAHRDALHAALAGRTRAVVLVGKSMGSRVGCHLATELPARSVSRVVCLGYPLVGQSGKARDEVLLALDVPVLFVQGTRDKLCPIDGLNAVRKKMKAPSELYVVESGDHSLLATKTWLREAGRSQADVDAAILAAIARHLR